ncbi:MAG: hypothetical protein HZA01_05985 [Nitrospinae bacterium]|nr:hypothetical protein [Nitrospinota bacterium]
MKERETRQYCQGKGLSITLNGYEKKLCVFAALCETILKSAAKDAENADGLTMGEAGIYIDYDSSMLKPVSVGKTILSGEYEWRLSAQVY